jgi:hypothetical protein
MKHLLFILLLLTVTFSTAAQEKNLDSMIHKIFYSVNGQDELAYLKLFPNRLQMKQLVEIETKGKATKAQDSLISEMFGLNSDVAYENVMPAIFLRSFGHRLEEIERLGINKNSMVLKGYTLNNLIVAKDSGVNGVMYLFANGKDYEMKFKDVFWSATDSVWLGVELVGIIPKGGKYNENKMKRSSNEDHGPPVGDASKPKTTKPPAKRKTKS